MEKSPGSPPEQRPYPQSRVTPTRAESSELEAKIAPPPVDPNQLAMCFDRAHNHMRDGDGLQPPEALDELLKFLFLLLHQERSGGRSLAPTPTSGAPSRSDRDTRWAQELQAALISAIAAHQTADENLLSIEPFTLSTSTLCRVAEELKDLRYSDLSFDIKSTALRVFITSNLRKGLGIYLTPDSVVKMVVNSLRPSPGSRILDPAAGSGSFLLHTLFYWRESGLSDALKTETPLLWGVERNPRILRVASLNLSPLIGGRFMRWHGDSLSPFPDDGSIDSPPPWFKPGAFDYIMTNPPFGVSVTARTLRDGSFTVTGSSEAAKPNRIGSEVLFIERCLDLLREGGRLAVVVPNSVVTNLRLAKARAALQRKGRLSAVVALPPETFATTGTQASTSVLFFERRQLPDSDQPSEVYYASSSNVGFDRTGRNRADQDLEPISAELRAFFDGERRDFTHGAVMNAPAGLELSTYADELGSQTAETSTTSDQAPTVLPLHECASLIRNGRTPLRSAYVNQGHFILKVGNLGRSGIDWASRDRNHVETAYLTRLRRGVVGEQLLVQPGDILLTSSAHSVKYIAKKVNMVDFIPDFIKGPITFVGELMLIRPRPEIVDPYYLLAYLRSPGARAALQAMVRGQTAHLMPKDARELSIPLGPARREENKALQELLRDDTQSRHREIERRQRIQRLSDQLFDTKREG